MFYVFGFLGAIILANLSVAYFGPASMPINAFLFIGLDISMRDKLHETWHGKNLVLKMLGLIIVGAVLTYLLNRDAGMVCVASVIAFTVALLVDAVIYQLLIDKNPLTKINASNLGSSLADSILFPTIAFGVLMPKIVLLQFLAKLAGGAFWAWIISRPRQQAV